ncbi:MAG TPA: response regulator transcription factor, partial [Candidatus Melainabacteria bacterium]|nr:response regulator transcription factor [Candidatus Melainabacteria bacterium]
MAKVLLVEDDEDLAVTISDMLNDERYTVDTVHNGLDAMEILKNQSYEVVILDWDLPGKSGISILREYRSAGGGTPVIMLTGKSEIEQKEQGLDSGADDYLTKPFHLKELAARVRSLLRRPTMTNSGALTWGPLVLDPAKFELTRDGEQLRLLPRDFALLEFLMRHPTKIFSAQALLDGVWNYDSDATPEGLRVAIRRIRKVIDKSDNLETSMIEN